MNWNNYNQLFPILHSVDADLDGQAMLSEVENEEERQKLLEQIMMFLASGDSEEW